MNNYSIPLYCTFVPHGYALCSDILTFYYMTYSYFSRSSHLYNRILTGKMI